MTTPKYAYILRTCNADLTSYNGFKWPATGVVVAPDWNPKPECGNGLHGALNGEGDGDLLKWEPDAKWLVVKVFAKNIIDLQGKVKFPRGRVVHCGDRLSATAYISKRCPGAVVIGGTATAGENGTATAGYRGTATAGHGGTATAGMHGTATAGYGGTATAGENGTATAWHGGTATAGMHGTATAGYGGTATAGYGGTATAGENGTATAGDSGTATAGENGTATAGHGGELRIRWWDGSRYRLAVGYIGENGLLPNVRYRCEGGKFVAA